MARSMTILVTGAAGHVGAEVTARLAKAGCGVIALVHRNGDLVRNGGGRIRTTAAAPGTAPAPGSVGCVTGDVTAPGLGLTATAHRALASQVDRIVHCAAITDFGCPAEVYQSVNVDGTAHLLELAGAASAPFVHVSTAYVCGERDGTVTEGELDAGQRFGNLYEDSKLRAETLVRKASADGLPVAVVRPSIVTGAERSGVVRDFKNIYIVLRLATEGKVRSIPGHYGAALDLVPVDYVADLAAAAVTRFEEAEGRTFHAVGGALSLRDFSDVLAEYPSFRVPRFVPPTVFDVAALPPAERPYYQRIVSPYESYFRRRLDFDDTDAAAFCRSAGRRVPSAGRPYLRRLLDHGLRAGYLGRTR
jgi:thioester reductase-like protein